MLFGTLVLGSMRGVVGWVHAWANGQGLVSGLHVEMYECIMAG